MNREPQIIHLAGGGASCVIEAAPALVRILHWGARLSADDVEALAATSTPAVTYSSFDAPRTFSLVPVSGVGWSGSPGVEWHRGGTATDPRLEVTSVTPAKLSEEHTCGAVKIVLDDADAGVQVVAAYTLDSYGVLRVRHRVTSTKADSVPLDVAAVRVAMPLPARATELVDLTGRWTRERAPQRVKLRDGALRRATRRGRPGHDDSFVTLVGTEGFAFRSGEVWAAHHAWSGDSDISVERLPEGAGVHDAVMLVGELLAPGEIRLDEGQTYEAPEVLLVWSGTGMDGVSEAFHSYARGLDAHPSSPRPLTLNTWEAVYFDHKPATLLRLADVAASVGVERFVLDDGWFRGRPNDTAGLGDWWVDQAKWPHGVQELADAVRARGMQFGLWFEPEMVNPDSDLARQHPEWLLGNRQDAARWRHQLALDMTRTDVRAYLLDRMDEAVRTIGVDYIKWDHNRDLHGAVSGDAGVPAVRSQTHAMYALMDELRALHPTLEIESCASGGARVDLGVLSRAQRVWPSDSNDPIERQAIQRWTAMVVPPELMGAHIGPGQAHTTHRSSSLEFRMATALFGHAGIEWDLTECSAEELAAIAAWARMYKEFRPLLHSGLTVRADTDDDATMMYGVVSPTQDHALFAWVRVATSGRASSPRTIIPGLDPARHYQVITREDVSPVSRHQVKDPEWMSATEPLRFSGRFLAEVGLPLPILNPGAALLIELRS